MTQSIFSAIFSAAFSRHSNVVEESMQQLLPDVERAAGVILKTLKSGKKILVCGNGGSAADSQHFAAELAGRYKKNRRAYAAIALTTDTSVLTAIGNDYGFEHVFGRQVEALGRAGDLLIVFSTSGRSPNIQKAAARARALRLNVIVMTGARGTALAKKADVGIIVPSDETARVQEVHEIIYHAWCEYLDAKL